MPFDFKRFKSSLIQADCSLFENYAFKVMFCLFIFLFSSVFLFSLYNASQMKLSITYEGLNNLVFNVFRVPFSMAVVFFSLTTFFGLHVRSFQANKQIQITQEKNTFDNYYKHRDEFKKHIVSIFGENEILESCIFSTHKKLFPNARFGKFDINIDYCDSITEGIRSNSKRLRTLLIDMPSTNSDAINDSSSYVRKKNIIKGIVFHIEQDCYQVGVSFEKLLFKFNGDEIKLDESIFDYKYYDSVSIFCGFLISRLETMFSFDENYQTFNMRNRK